MAAGGLDQVGLLKDLRKQVELLEDDLRARAGEAEFGGPLRAEYERARAAGRTAAGFGSWLDGRVTQAAVAWVLGTVFVRFCEDNGLIPWPFIAGPGDRVVDAEERHGAFFQEHPACNDRDWLVAAVDALRSAHPTAAGVFDARHNPMWELAPSFEAAGALLGFWRRRGDDGEVRHDFTDTTLDTRFLGDIYEGLSEYARKVFALRQTPQFVEEFILDLTFEPAVVEFGLAGLRTIDPACGSGHFLLGIFGRLLAKWREAEPGTDEWTLIRRALGSVHGCDKNPFAASIARFRLLVAVLRAGKVDRLDQAPEFPTNIAVGDSLLHGRGAPSVQEGLFSLEDQHTYRTEDVHEFVESCDLLGRSSYHVVVGNPPYITVKDKQENQNYRDLYSACSGKYALSVPFAQRMFQLAVRTAGDERDAGFVGQITSNSFMKREFGKKLIEDFFPDSRYGVHLTHVIDTSGAYIPGHGTPTVILIGRNHLGRVGDPIRAVLGVRGEPSQPADPAKGLVWSAIVNQIGEPSSESEWVSVEDADRTRFAHHPWSISGGGAQSLMPVLADGKSRLGAQVKRLGVFGMTNADEVMLAPRQAWFRRTASIDFVSQLLLGDEIRDWCSSGDTFSFFPYDRLLNLVDLDKVGLLARWMWPCRTVLGNRVTFSKGTYFSDGRPWYEWHQLTSDAEGHPWFITFAFVATHNHFVLDRGGKVFKQTAPVIKLAAGAGENEHLGLLGVLNSSAACFWLKQVCQSKGNGGIGGGISDELWEHRFEFAGTRLQEYPLPAELPLGLGQALDALAQRLASYEPSAVCAEAAPTRDRLDAARTEQERVRGLMVALQEELDWRVYGSYGLLTEAEVTRLTTPDLDAVPEVALGERAFEIVLARRVAAGEAETAWFTRHGSTPITEIPGHWPGWYRDIVAARIDTIERRADLALIERPECKRRWAVEPWAKRERDAVRSWLLDRCEDRELWFGLRDGVRHPRTQTVSQLADRLRDDAEFTSVAALYAADHLGRRDAPLADVLGAVVAEEHVPYLAALRYTDTGLRKRAEWEHVWDLQREEDRTNTRLDIPVPPKYGHGDFRKTSYWSARGKLDVPKERFVSYPGASPDADDTLLLGWAGWDHAEQAQALVNLVNDRTADAAWDTTRLTPLLAGLAEQMPWVAQWHSGYDPEWGGDPTEEYQTYLDDQRTRHHLTENDLRAWRPAPTRRGRKTGGATRTA